MRNNQTGHATNSHFAKKKKSNILSSRQVKTPSHRNNLHHQSFNQPSRPTSNNIKLNQTGNQYTSNNSLPNQMQFHPNLNNNRNADIKRRENYDSKHSRNNKEKSRFNGGSQQTSYPNPYPLQKQMTQPLYNTSKGTFRAPNNK